MESGSGLVDFGIDSSFAGVEKSQAPGLTSDGQTRHRVGDLGPEGRKAYCELTHSHTGPETRITHCGKHSSTAELAWTATGSSTPFWASAEQSRQRDLHGWEERTRVLTGIFGHQRRTVEAQDKARHTNVHEGAN